MLTYKRKLILTKSQQIRIDSWIGTCRCIYNIGLEIRIAAWRNCQKSVHKFELMKQITTIRNIDWIKDVPIATLQNSIERLDASYKQFFLYGGFPKWATKRKYNSITFKETLSVKGNKIKIPKIGFIKIFKDSPILGEIKIIRIKKEVNGYFACVTCHSVSKSIQNSDKSQVIGLDMGITHFYADSNGNFISNPKHFKKYERKKIIESRSLSRKKKGSNSWKKQCRKLALLHHKIADIRKDFLHKESTRLAKEYNIVFIENLNISGMVKNQNLSKHIMDCGWGMFKTMLEYKTKVIKVDAKYTSQTCNECGNVDSKNRISQSEFVCANCGYSENADVNAAKNILSKGVALSRQREALACA